MDATKMLEKQQEEVRDLFHDYRKLDGGDRQEKLGLEPSYETGVAR